jgi:protein-S-isoprenylcysteine O-methyltransferase Ste14
MNRLIWQAVLAFVALPGVVVATGFHLRVVYGEEPSLARSFGERWLRYTADVPRWFRWPTK